MKIENVIISSIILVATATASIFMYSCSKDELEMTNTTTATKQIEGVEVIDGILHFESADAFFEVSKTLSEMTEEEKDAWEESIGFYSMRRKINSVYQELECTDDENEIKNILKKNNNIFKMDEDSCIMPYEGYLLQDEIITEKAIFYINNTLNTVEKDIKDDDNYTKKAFSYNACGYEPEQTYTVDKRNIHVAFKITGKTINDGNKKYYTYIVGVYLQNNKKSFGWKPYTTTYTLKDAYIEYDAPIYKNGTIVYEKRKYELPYISGENSYYKDAFYVPYNQKQYIIPEGYEAENHGFRTVVFMAHNRGLGSKWLDFECGDYNNPTDLE